VAYKHSAPGGASELRASDSVLFPFVLAFLGLALILVTVLGQHYVRQRMKEAD